MPHDRETARLHELIRDPNTPIDYIDHAEDEMAKDRVSQTDVETVLGRSGVTEIQPPGRMFRPDRWKVMGNDDDERMLTIIVEVDEEPATAEITVVTVWDNKRGRARKR